MLKRLLMLIGALVFAALATLTPAAAEKATKREKADKLVAAAAETVAYFAHDEAYEPLWEAADDAKAMVIIPSAWRAGFIFGAEAGNAVMVARNEDGSWSEPTFFTIGSVSFGLQIGGQNSENILLIMTRRGMEQMLSTNVKLGADLSLAAGPVGGGAKAQTVDVLAFTRARGAYGGMTIEGAVLKSRQSLNRGYYGADVTPTDIIFRNKVARPNSATLQNAVWALAHRDQQPALVAPVQPVNVDPVTGEPLPEKPVYDDDAAYGAPLEPIGGDDDK